MSATAIKNFNVLASEKKIEVIYRRNRYLVSEISTTHITFFGHKESVEIKSVNLPNLSNFESDKIIVVDDYQGNNCRNKWGHIKKIVPTGNDSGFVYNIYFYNGDTRNSQWWIPEELIRPVVKKHILQM